MDPDQEQSDLGPHCLPVCKNRFEKFARIFRRRHKQTTFSDVDFLGVLRVSRSSLLFRVPCKGLPNFIYLYILPFTLTIILGRSRCCATGNLRSKTNEVRFQSAKGKEMKDDKLKWWRIVNPYPAEHDNPTFANIVDPDQMASKEAIWSGSTLFVMQFVNWMNTLYQVIWLVDG